MKENRKTFRSDVMNMIDKTNFLIDKNVVLQFYSCN